MKYFFSLLLLGLLNFTTLEAQIDWTSWTSLQVNYKAGDKVTLIAKPIMRSSDNLSKYSDTSIDFIVAYKINSRWSASLLNRHFWIPDNGDREFFFVDLNYKYELNTKWVLTNKVRYHLAINWTREDPDFIRYLPVLVFKAKEKVNFSVGADMFYRIEEVSTLSGGRYMLGSNINLAPKLKLSLAYWLQIKHNDEYPIGEFNNIVVNLAYTIN